jgi:hypothetical protein
MKKRRTRKEAAELAAAVYSEYENGMRADEIAEKYKITKGYVWQLIVKHRESPEIATAEDFDTALGNYLEKAKEKIKIMVFAGDIQEKNFLTVSVENPELTDPDDYDRELRYRIRRVLKYCFATQGFELLEEEET